MPRLCGFGGYAIEEAVLELTKRGAGMTILFLLVTGVCQSLNELGVVSVTKNQKRTSRTACYGPGPVVALKMPVPLTLANGCNPTTSFAQAFQHASSNDWFRTYTAG